MGRGMIQYINMAGWGSRSCQLGGDAGTNQRNEPTPKQKKCSINPECNPETTRRFFEVVWNFHLDKPNAVLLSHSLIFSLSRRPTPFSLFRFLVRQSCRCCLPCSRSPLMFLCLLQ